MMLTEMFRRSLHLSCVSYNVKKQGLKLCRMVNPHGKRKWHPTFSEVNTLPSVKSLTKVTHEPDKRGIRRVAVLNKLFMKNITDIMSTGTASMEIIGRGIEISKVNITPDLQRVNVFWVCKGNSTDEETDEVLRKVAGALRHELSTLRVMGEVPYIDFVKDKEETRLVDLDRRLALADYGEEFTPTDAGHRLKSEFTLKTTLSPEMKAKIKQLEELIPVEEDPIPEMTHCVFGLDHDKIMNRLLAARKKTKDAWSSISEENSVKSFRATDEMTSPKPDLTNQKKELADFLKKRQIEQEKIHKRLRDTRNIPVHFDDPAEPSDEPYDELDDDYDEDDDSFYYRELDRLRDIRNKDNIN